MTSTPQAATLHRMSRTTGYNTIVRPAAQRFNEMLSMGVPEVASASPRCVRFRREAKRLSSIFLDAVGQKSPKSLPMQCRSEGFSLAVSMGPQNSDFEIVPEERFCPQERNVPGEWVFRWWGYNLSSLSSFLFSIN
jgi:hypothetical protein